MIRLFAPATPDSLFRRSPVTAGNFVLHLLVVVALCIPVGRAVKEGILEQLAVYLVPPDNPGTLLHASGSAPLSSAAAPDPGQSPTGAAAVAEAAEALLARGVLPGLRATELVAARRTLVGENALTELEVDSAVVRDPTSAAPEYPAALLKKGVEGYASVVYVVDTLGAVDMMTYRVVMTTHPEFAEAVERALPHMHFNPAVQKGRRVRQLVEQTFRFKVTARDTSSIPGTTPGA